MNTNLNSLWFDATGNQTRVLRFSSRRSVHSTTDRPSFIRILVYPDSVGQKFWVKTAENLRFSGKCGNSFHWWLKGLCFRLCGHTTTYRQLTLTQILTVCWFPSQFPADSWLGSDCAGIGWLTVGKSFFWESWNELWILFSVLHLYFFLSSPKCAVGR